MDARFALPVEHPVGNVEGRRNLPPLTDARTSALSLHRQGGANEPAPWLPRVESLELRSSQRKAPPVLRERQPLRGGAQAADLDLSQRDSLISRRAVARQVTDGCPDSPLAFRAECLLERGGLGLGGLFPTRHAWARQRRERLATPKPIAQAMGRRSSHPSTGYSTLHRRSREVSHECAQARGREAQSAGKSVVVRRA